MSGRGKQPPFDGVSVLKAREVQQEVCQLRHRADYAKVPSSNGQLGTPEQMTCAIIAKMHALCESPPKKQLAKIIPLDKTRLRKFLVERHWPNDKLIPFEVFGRVVRWLLTGDERPAGSNKRGGETLAIATEIEQYFFPRKYRSGVCPYFKLGCRHVNTPFNHPELASMIAWIRRQVTLQRDLGRRARGLIVLLVQNENLAKGAIDWPCELELAQAAVQDENLVVRIVIPKATVQQHGPNTAYSVDELPEWEWMRSLRAACDKKRQKQDGPTGQGIDILAVTENLVTCFLNSMHPLLYVSFDANEDRRISRLLFLRPFGGSEANTPLTFRATEEEQVHFQSCVHGLGIIDMPERRDDDNHQDPSRNVS